MVDNPLELAHAWIDAGAGMVTFQLEGARHPHRVLQSMAGGDVIRGVALTPSTPVSLVAPLLDELELVLVLAVNPGWSGQSFLPDTPAPIREALALIGDRDVLLPVDGAITRDGIAAELAAAGADVIVSGSAVFDGDAGANAKLMLAQIRAQPGSPIPLPRS
jgi:ribulose-phosphate 3-epimerase